MTTILLVEPRHETRARLVQAITVEKVVARIIATNSLHDTLQLMRNRERADIVFVSGRFEEHQRLAFVSAAKNTRYGIDSAFILLLEGLKGDNTSVAKHLLKGMDGFLASPFTVETMQRVIRVAAKVKLAKLRQRVQTASRLVLRNALDEIDFIAYDASHTDKPLALPDELTRSAKILRSFGDDELEVYFEVLAEMAAHAAPTVHFVDFNINADIPELPAAASVENEKTFKPASLQRAENLRGFFMKLAPVCGRAGDREDCPLRKIRSSTRAERIEFLNARTQEELEEILESHHSCRLRSAPAGATHTLTGTTRVPQETAQGPDQKSPANMQ